MGEHELAAFELQVRDVRAAAEERGEQHRVAAEVVAAQREVPEGSAGGEVLGEARDGLLLNGNAVAHIVGDAEHGQRVRSAQRDKVRD